MVAKDCKSSEHDPDTSQGIFISPYPRRHEPGVLWNIRGVRDTRQRFGTFSRDGAGDGQGAETVEPRNEEAKATEIGENRRYARAPRSCEANICRSGADRPAEWPAMSDAAGHRL